MNDYLIRMRLSTIQQLLETLQGANKSTQEIEVLITAKSEYIAWHKAEDRYPTYKVISICRVDTPAQLALVRQKTLKVARIETGG